MSTDRNYGYFNAIYNQETETYDRLYNADTFNKYFAGLINLTGVFSNYGNKFATSYDGFNVSVGTGKLIINGCWYVVEGDPQVIAVPEADSGATAARIDYIVAKWDKAARQITLEVKKGKTGSGKPPKPEGWTLVTKRINDRFVTVPSLVMSSDVIEMPIVQYTIRPNTEAISAMANVVGGPYCPWISHLVLGPDATDIDRYLQGILTLILDWTEHLQEDLQVSTYIQSYRKIVSGGDGASNSIPMNLTPIHSDDPLGYHFSEGDQIFVFYNGFNLKRDGSASEASSYSDSFYVDTSYDPPRIIINGDMGPNDTVEIIVLKSQIGVPSYMDGDGEYY